MELGVTINKELISFKTLSIKFLVIYRGNEVARCDEKCGEKFTPRFMSRIFPMRYNIRYIHTC